MAPLAQLAVVGLMIASGVVAAPWDRIAKHTTHGRRTVGPRKIQISSYQPESTFEAWNILSPNEASKLRPRKPQKHFSKPSWVSEPKDLFARRAIHVVANEYFRQQFNQIPVANAVANVAIKDDKVVSFGASFIKPKSVAPATPAVPKQNAIAKAESLTGAKYNSFPVGLQYFAKDTDYVVLTFTVQVQSEATGEWYLVYVDASNGEVVNLVDFRAAASYRAIPFTFQSPNDGFQVTTDPHDAVASPNGWHKYGSVSTTTTSGNNIVAYKSSLSGTSSQSSATNNYNYVFNPSVAPTVRPNVDAARVNAFYIGNMVHDLTYRYGFTETKFNFQENNNGLGGAQYDRVQISVQDSSGQNDVTFATPPDGQRPTLRVSLVSSATPQRDGALENDIIVHEYTHGISNRLTGGGTATCLSSNEASGLGEGWSDALADWTEQTSAVDRDFTLGTYLYGKSLRNYPYSTSKTTNPLTYASLRTLTGAHDIGEVWALIWHEIYAGLIAARGFTANKNDPTLTTGNTVALQLLIDALSLQPCNPTFITARNAIIQADSDRYSGANYCTLWKAFAKRGLGYGATVAKADSTTLPSGC